MKCLFTRKWIAATALVVLAVGVMVRLGLWQLDRLAERRAFNARVSAQLEQPPFELTRATWDRISAEMEYRSVRVIGEYDFSQQVALRNQAYENHAGVHLLTPLVIAGTERAVLVNRGWIPAEQAAPANWRAFDEPGVVEVRGVLRRAQTRADFGGISDPPGFLFAWNLANVERIAQQVAHPLLPVYLQQTPAPLTATAARVYPIRSKPNLDLTEGSHLGYALQWFVFAGILAIGYPQFVRAQK